MQSDHLLRRDFLTYGSAAFAGLTVLRSSIARAFPARPGEEVIPWADQPPPVPDAASGVVQNLPKWEDLSTWLTPNEQFFSVAHYNRPVIDEKSWALEIGGSVARPLRLALDDIKARPRREVVFTMECSGNHGFPWLTLRLVMPGGQARHWPRSWRKRKRAAAAGRLCSSAAMLARSRCATSRYGRTSLAACRLLTP